MIDPWGAGKPDYYVPTIASRPVVVDEQLEQVKWIANETYSIAARAVAISDIYTVPTGYSLSFGGGHISVKDSCINNLRLLAGSESLIGDFRYDMRGDFIMTSLSGQVISAGTTITAYVYNNDTLTSEFSLTATGVLTRT